jgi:hypothetical protein
MRIAKLSGRRWRTWLLAAAWACTASVPAQPSGASPVAPPAAVASSAPLSMAQVVERLGRQGFADFREVERKGATHFEVKARDAQRNRVELLVDAHSGEIVKSKPDR